MNYSKYKDIFKGEQMPFAFVDKTLLDENINNILKRSGDKKIRIASKSVRCRWVLDYILQSNNQFQGIMCYSVNEAAWLADQGFDDLLVAYPCFHEKDIKSIIPALKEGKRIYLMTDLPEHLHQLQKIASSENVDIPVCMDMDMSSTIGPIYFGVYRSSINNLDAAKRYLDALKKCPNVQLKSLMGYEAQIAGVGDNVKGKSLMNAIISFLKKKSIKEVAKRRKEIYDLCINESFNIEVVNGGGTGSLESTKEESCVTEVTVGSGFYASHLFDNYKQFKHLPATAYAIEIVRQSQNDIYTSLGGGYVASGGLGIEKLPQIYLPKEAQLIKEEMAGEVQTPFKYKGKEDLKLGDPIFMRHSKAGELCEHFKELLIIDNEKIINRVPTYRGEGQCFL